MDMQEDMGFRFMMPDTSLEPTPVTSGCFRLGFRIDGSHQQRGSVLCRQ